MPSLLNKVNFTKGWPSKSIVEEVLKPDTGVTIEAGFIGRRKLTAPDVWILGITDIAQEPFIFRNESDDPDAGRPAHESDYAQVPYGGVQGISFQNPLEIETIQYAGTPTAGAILSVGSNGKLKVGVAGEIAVAQCIKAAYWIGQHHYIKVVPIQRYVIPGA